MATTTQPKQDGTKLQLKQTEALTSVVPLTVDLFVCDSDGNVLGKVTVATEIANYSARRGIPYVLGDISFRHPTLEAVIGQRNVAMYADSLPRGARRES